MGFETKFSRSPVSPLLWKTPWPTRRLSQTRRSSCLHHSAEDPPGNVYVYACKWMYVYLCYVYTHICIHVYVVFIYIHIYVHIYVFIHTCTSWSCASAHALCCEVCVDVCVCMCVCMCVSLRSRPTWGYWNSQSAKRTEDIFYYIKCKIQGYSSEKSVGSSQGPSQRSSLSILSVW